MRCLGRNRHRNRHMKCPVNETGFCPRHQTVHHGLALQFSQQESSFGDRYRQALDEVFGVHSGPRDQPKRGVCRHLGRRVRLPDGGIKKHSCKG